MKGISTHVVTLVLAVIIGILILIALFPAFKRVYAYIQEQLGLQKPLTQVEKAILCSYYRCSDGCGANGELTTQKYCQEFEPSACAEPVANGAYEGNNFAVCGINAKKYPINVTVEDTTINRRSIDDVIDSGSCFVTDDIKWSSAIKSNFVSYIYTSKNNLATYQTDTCFSAGMGPFEHSVLDTITDAKLKSKTNFIYTYNGEPPIQGFKPVGLFIQGEATTVISPEFPCDVILEKDVSKVVDFSNILGTEEKLICIKDSDYSVSFSYRSVYWNSVIVTINGSESTLSISYGQQQSEPETWYFEPGHTFTVIWLGENKFNITYTYSELPPVSPPSKQGEYLPSDYDSWTESLNGWSPPEEVELKDKTTDPQDVKYGEHSIHMSIEGSNIGFNFEKAGISGGEIDLKNWEKVHFWYKSKHKGWGEGWSISFHVINSWKALRCDIPESEDWKEITIDLKNDCEKINEYNWEKVNWIEFGSSLYNELWIDQFYLFKSA